MVMASLKQTKKNINLECYHPCHVVPCVILSATSWNWEPETEEGPEPFKSSGLGFV